MGDTLSRMIIPVLTVLVSNLVTRLLTMGVLTPESSS